MKSDMKLGEIAYAAFAAALKQDDESRETVLFEDLPRNLKEVWRATGSALRKELIPPTGETLRPSCPKCDSEMTPSDFVCDQIKFPSMTSVVIFCKHCGAVLSVDITRVAPPARSAIVLPG